MGILVPSRYRIDRIGGQGYVLAFIYDPSLQRKTVPGTRSGSKRFAPGWFRYAVRESEASDQLGSRFGVSRRIAGDLVYYYKWFGRLTKRSNTMVNIIKFFSLLTGLAGWILLWSLDWKMAVAMFLIIWGNNNAIKQ